MNLIIDLSQDNPRLALEENSKTIGKCQWDGIYQLSETILSELDKLLAAHGYTKKNIGEVKIVPSEKSMAGTRIAQAIALGLKTKVEK